MKMLLTIQLLSGSVKPDRQTDRQTDRQVERRDIQLKLSRDTHAQIIAIFKISAKEKLHKFRFDYRGNIKALTK